MRWRKVSTLNSAKLATLLAAQVLSGIAAAQTETLSDPRAWSGDFMRGASPTSSCATDTIENLRERMAVSGPFTVEEYEQTVSHRNTTADEPDKMITVFNKASEFVRQAITSDDQIYSFQYLAGSGGSFWGFTGYLVVRDECIIHVEVTSNIN